MPACRAASTVHARSIAKRAHRSADRRRRSLPPSVRKAAEAGPVRRCPAGPPAGRGATANPTVRRSGKPAGRLRVGRFSSMIAPTGSPSANASSHACIPDRSPCVQESRIASLRLPGSAGRPSRSVSWSSMPWSGSGVSPGVGVRALSVGLVCRQTATPNRRATVRDTPPHRGETTIAARRFCARPVGVRLSPTGSLFPFPMTATRFPSSPTSTSSIATTSARRRDSSRS